MNKQLESGNQYTLQDLFSGERKIIIPDLQRDYCWGDKKHGKENIELVTGFVSGIIDLFEEYQNSTDEKDTEHQLGMIYAYENPLNFIQLIDGQQRITTLYLLLGMLYKYSKSENEDLRRILISDFELKEDDKEPHLQYAIRESTLYFLSDLVCEFFLKNDSDNFSINKIKKKEKWYFSEYDLDPTIQSMLSALSIIDKLIKKNIKIDEFAEFIMQKIKFFYFDMQNWEHGEDMFVVINTTGEPLTATENLKPKLIGDIEDEENRKKASDIWEKWEAYFWQNKKNNEHVADDGLNEFLKFYWQIKTKQVTYSLKDILQNIEPKEEIDGINEYFEQYKKLAEYFNEANFKSVFNSINQDATTIRAFTEEQKLLIILPMLNFMKEFPDEKEQHRLFLRRLRKNYYDNQWEERNKNFIDWRHIIQIIEKSTSEQDVLTFDTSSEERKKEFKTISNVPLNSWYNEEEQYKTELRETNIENKIKIEKWEDHKDFMGDISFLIKVHSKVDSKTKNDKPTIGDLESYYQNYINTIDLVRNTYGEEENKDPLIEKKKLSNLFRLFYLFIGCNKVEHIYRTSWEYFEGVAFSSINRSHLWNDEFQKMCIQTNVRDYVERFIKDYAKNNDLFSLNESNFTPERAIKCWLTLKVFNANKQEVALAYYDGNDTGVAAYSDMDNNRLIENEAFSLGNFICGFAVKSGGGGGNYIHITGKELWLKPNIIDTPFAGIEFENRNRNQIEENYKKIQEIIDDITA